MTTLKRMLSAVAIIGLSAAAVFSAVPATAATIGNTAAAFLTSNTYFSSMSPDGSKILYQSEYGLPTILDTATGDVTEVTDDYNSFSDAGGSVFSADGSTVYVVDWEYNTIVTIDVATAAVTGSIPVASGGPGGPWTIAISPDGASLYIGHYSDDAITIYDIANESFSYVTLGVSNSVSIYPSPDGARVYVVSSSGEVGVYDVATESALEPWLNVDSGSFYGSCVNSDTSVLYLPSENGDEVWSVSLADGSVLAHTNTLSLFSAFGCAVAPNGGKLFITDWDTGFQQSGQTDVTEPGVIYELDPTTLAYDNVEYSFDGVAYTTVMNFTTACNAYVAGYYGNAQSFELDAADCVMPDTATPASASLASTGVDGFSLSAGVLAGLALLGIGVAVLRRRAVASEV